MTDRRIGDWPHTMHSGYEPDASSNRVTHGRHCSCTPCRAQDWNDPGLAPCGMHPKGCPPDADVIPNRVAWIAALDHALNVGEPSHEQLLDLGNLLAWLKDPTDV